MKSSEASEINQFLARLEGSNKPHEIYVDNLHFPYFEFQEDYVIPPSSSVDGMDFSSSMGYLQAIAGFLPELLEHSFILPEPRPKKEVGKIFLTRELPSYKEQRYLWILALESTYLGGADKSKILSTGIQGRTTSLRTNRIYFSSKIIPVESIVRERDEIRSFDPYEMGELIRDIYSGQGGESRIKPYSEIFDDQDFSKQEEALEKIYGIDQTVWKIGKVFRPLGIDYLAVGLRLLESKFSDIEKIWKFLAGDFQNPEGNLEHLHEYFSLFSMEESLSASGNRRWKIFKSR